MHLASNNTEQNTPIFLKYLQCTGRENCLLDCDSDPIGSRDAMCTHERDVHIKCEGKYDFFSLFRRVLNFFVNIFV